MEISKQGETRQRGLSKMLHWKLKNCTKCGGDLFIDKDLDGWFEQCLQCGYRKELKELKKQTVTAGAHTEDWSRGAEN
jgi:DNA-directed RNA polymerase subunit M/transcription elongation factor TFIIS